MVVLVSIVIPFYNEERYLERAVQSALAQSYPAVEIILVNDGATDNSPAIAQALSKEHDNVILVNIPNGGPGGARNAGIAVAGGSYLTFLDSDDILAPDAIRSWMVQIGDADIVIGKFSMQNITNGSGWITGWKGEGGTVSGEEGIRAMYEYRMASTVWAKLYRTRILKTLSFPDAHWFEDRYFLLSYLLQAARIVFDKNIGLEILSRQDSLTRRLLSEQKIKDAHAIYLRELELVRHHSRQLEFTRLIDRHQINALIETMIILYYDKDQLPLRKGLEQCLSAFIEVFVKQLRQNQTPVGLRDRADLFLLRLHRFAGWPFTYLLLPLWKRKKCRAVLVLKSF